MKYTFFKRTIVNFSMGTIQPEQGLEMKISLNVTKRCVYD